MKGYEIAVAFLIVVVFAVAIRLQFNSVAGKVATQDQTQLFPATTPVIGTICKHGGNDCLLFPTVTPLFEEKPVHRGISLPGEP